MLHLSVLDQSVAGVGKSHGQTIRDTVAMAELCESLGYKRFWVSEHHSHPTIVGTAPEILLAGIAMRTNRIRLGSAGVMLPHYAPLKVAEQFRVLEAFAPGRIDLGLGRAPGTDGRTSLALNPAAAERPAEFPNDVQDLMAWVSGQPLPEGHPFAAVQANPQGETSPEIWMLGSSLYGAQVAAHFGLPYSFAWFFTEGQGGPEAIQIYRDRYQPSERFPEPCPGICVWALAAETEEEAHYHFASRARDPPSLVLHHSSSRRPRAGYTSPLVTSGKAPAADNERHTGHAPTRTKTPQALGPHADPRRAARPYRRDRL